MQIEARSAFQTKLKDLALTTMRTEHNIKKLKIYLNEDGNNRQNIKQKNK